MDALIFIDTNIFLDFYRYPQGSAVLPILGHIDASHKKIITGNQVEMEFKKNRQNVILKSLGQLKGPTWDAFKVPVILSETQPAQAILKSKNKIENQSNKLQRRIEAVLRNPAQNDVVYQTVQRLFRNGSPFNLTRENIVRFTIRRLARKRFMLGYPPKKSDDTSIGDAVNWEWLIRCAKERNTNVVIVSRDSDYGYRYGSEPIINDWLVQEFRERVSRKKRVVLTHRLTHAFELAQIAVKPKEVEDEGKLIDEISAHAPTAEASSKDLWPGMDLVRGAKAREDFNKAMENVLQYLNETWPPKKTGG